MVPLGSDARCWYGIDTQSTPRGATMPSNDTDRSPQTWTTGQGIGFLVAMIGTVLVVLAVTEMLIAVSTVDPGEDVTPELVESLGMLVAGVVAVIPGVVVFRKSTP